MASKTVLADVGGFTPVIDYLVNDVGLRAAAVFGTIWRFCQMDDHVCYASLEKIGGRLGLRKGTVYKDVVKLVAAGYLKDISPDDLPERRPHTYADTGKAQIRINIAATVTAPTAGSRPAVSTGNNSFQGKLPVSTGNTSSFQGKPKKENLRDRSNKELKTAAATTAAVAADLVQSEDYLQVYELLQSASVQEPTREKLAVLDWATPEYVGAQVRYYLEVELPEEGAPPGRLIQRIQHHDPIPGDSQHQRDSRGISGGKKVGRQPAPFKIPTKAQTGE